MTEEQLRAQYPDISDDLVRQILSLSAGDPSHYAKQYEQGEYLRKMATQGDVKTAPGAIAQTLAGFTVARRNKEYANAIREYQGNVVKAKKNWFDEFTKRGQRPEEPEPLGMYGGY